jgi:hypothetical protein
MKSCATGLRVRFLRVTTLVDDRGIGSSTAPGPQGPAGPPGPAGPAGPKGDSGLGAAIRVVTGTDSVRCGDDKFLAGFVCASGATDGPKCATPGTAATGLLRAFVAMRAQGLQLTKPKRIDVTSVWNDMVHDAGCSDPAFARAHATKRLDLQLIACPFAPTFSLQVSPLTQAQSLAHRRGEAGLNCERDVLTERHAPHGKLNRAAFKKKPRASMKSGRAIVTTKVGSWGASCSTSLSASQSSEMAWPNMAIEVDVTAMLAK